MSQGLRRKICNDLEVPKQSTLLEDWIAQALLNSQSRVLIWAVRDQYRTYKPEIINTETLQNAIDFTLDQLPPRQLIQMSQDTTHNVKDAPDNVRFIEAFRQERQIHWEFMFIGRTKREVKMWSDAVLKKLA